MPLDPKAKELLEAAQLLGLKEEADLTVAEARESMLRRSVSYQRFALDLPRIEDRSVPGPAGSIRIRIYYPTEHTPLPLLMFFHGGGWVLGNLDTHDALCRALSAHANAIVIGVDYRLAPEHPFPAGLDDCHFATRWVARHAAELGGIPDSLAISGDSAGGNLAAVTAIRLRDEGASPLIAQLLIYPITDYYQPGADSYRRFGSGFGLSRRTMAWFWDHYASPEIAIQAEASPLRTPDLSNLPPALIITAECDLLADEGRHYAERLRQAGNMVDTIEYPGMVHGFFRALGVYAQADDAISKAGKWLTRRWQSANVPAVTSGC